MADQDLPAHSSAIPSRIARGLFCPECRQLSKYRTVLSDDWLFPSSALNLDIRLPFRHLCWRLKSLVMAMDSISSAVDMAFRTALLLAGNTKTAETAVMDGI